MVSGQWWEITGLPVLKYLEGQAPDYLGRYYTDTLKWSDKELEKCHDQVQWVFPLHEASKHAFVHPVVTKDIAELASTSEKVRANLLAATERYKEFFGIGNYWDSKKHALWFTSGNHNLLRITRIIRSLRLFGLETEAANFRNAAIAAGPGDLSPEEARDVLSYWYHAIADDIWTPMQKKENPCEV